MAARIPGARLGWVVVRAVAVVLIVVTHVGLADVQGSAHVLLAVAGYNFARFGLVGERTDRLRRHLRSIARVVVPSVVLIGCAYLLTDRYSVANVLLLNALVGPKTWTTRWHFWFVEVLVYLLVGMAALLAMPQVDRAERRAPFAFPVALLGAGLLTRYEVVDLAVPHTAPVLWLFALGFLLPSTKQEDRLMGKPAAREAAQMTSGLLCQPPPPMSRPRS